jgi:MFS transporter, Spinster family, sphingosine-1-phosphate transporter
MADETPAAQASHGLNLARSARLGLIVLTGMNLLNYLDRFIVSALVESLKASELHLTDTQCGALGTAFMIVYMAASPVFGGLGDRRNRPRLVAFGVALWSAATAAAGFANGFVHLFAARATVGVGEAAYGTISPAMLADYFPKERRGRVFAIFFSAIPIGSALGYVLGGLMDRHFGWRAAFFVAGVPGVLLAGLALLLRDPPRGAHDQDEGTAHASGTGVLSAYRDLLKNAPYGLTVLGYAAYTFALGAMAFWMPAFLERVRGVPKEEATVTFGAIVVVTGFVGTFAGGWLGDHLLKYTHQSYLWVSGVATLLAVIPAAVALMSPSPHAFYTAMVIAEVLVFASTGPINSAIVNLVAPTERATAVALSIFSIHLLGDVPSPPLVGILSDASSLDRAVLVIPAVFAVSGCIWCFAAWHGGRKVAAPPAPH